MSEFSQWAAPISKPQKTNHAVVCMWQPASSLRVLSWVFVLMRTWQAVDEITGAHLNRHPEAHLRSWWGQSQTHTCSWAHKDTHTQVKASMQTCLHCLLLSMAVFFYTMWRQDIFSDLIAPSSGHVLSLQFEWILHCKYSEQVDI